MPAALSTPPAHRAPVAAARSPYLDGAVTDLPSTPMSTILLGTLPGSELLSSNGGVFGNPASPLPQPASPTQGHPLRRLEGVAMEARTDGVLSRAAIGAEPC